MRIPRHFLPEPSWRTAIIVLLAATMLVPVIFGSGFFFPYVVPRNLYFRVLVETGTAILVVALCFGRKRLDLRGEPIFLALVAFLAAATFSAAFSPARMHSFFGDFERMGGVWAWFNLVLFFLLLRTMRDEDWPWVLNCALAVSVFISVPAIAEHARATALAASSDALVTPSPSTIGNSGLLAAYLLMNAGLAAYLACTNARYRVLYLASCFVNVLALIYAANRATLVGLVLGAIVAGVVFTIVSTQSRKKWIAPAVVAALTLLAFGSIATIRAFPSSGITEILPAGLRRLALNYPPNSEASRTMQWRAAIEGFKDRPLLGYGPENHNLVWSAHFDPGIVGVDTEIFDRTHNQFLEMMATTGIVGSVAFLGIWLAIGMTLVRAYRAGRISAAAASVLWGLQLAYATYLFFWFVDLNSTMLWIMVAALVASRATVGPIVLEATGTDPHPATARPALAVSAVLVLLVALYAEGYTPLVANRALARLDTPSGSVADELKNLDLLSNSSARQTAHTPVIMAEYISSLRPRLSEMRANAAERKMLDRAFTESFAAFAREIHRDSLNDRLYMHEAGLLMEAAQFYQSSTYRQQAIGA
ncbi:MAG TPA: O-antigen ligase family protein, partial [Gemmatimonadaceae bacterium]|nr:O-antigen ligase family protein [Gemmatimonadaceae bacterium]